MNTQVENHKSPNIILELDKQLNSAITLTWDGLNAFVPITRNCINECGNIDNFSVKRIVENGE